MQCGYLIVKTYDQLYQYFANKYHLTKDIYGIPRIDKIPSESQIKYHGIDRDALDCYEDSNELAEIYLYELMQKGKSLDGFVFSEIDLLTTISFLSTPSDYETIWIKIANTNATPPEGYKSIGFEPSYFTSDHFSASCDCMLFPRWHGTDDEGTLFLSYFNELNKDG